VLGVDISETLLTFARNEFSHIENLEFNTCDAQNYKFKVGSFDKVISRFGMMFFENPIEAIKNIH
jgi:ubiquinone/menaquinone biosynthesis C-methylase UbiE